MICVITHPLKPSVRKSVWKHLKVSLLDPAEIRLLGGELGGRHLRDQFKALRLLQRAAANLPEGREREFRGYCMNECLPG